MEAIFRIRDKFIPEPLPPLHCFTGHTVVITGGTTGLGLAAATHFINLGAHVIITCRNRTRGESAKTAIENLIGAPSQGKIEVMELDMDSYRSCCKFVNSLKDRRMSDGTPKTVECVVLNAGCMNTQYVESPEGWEETIQVNSLSSSLLGLLLLPWLKTQISATVPRLVFVTSRDHVDVEIKDWVQWAEEEGILRHLSSKAAWPSANSVPDSPNYANSKLLLMYAVEEISKLALGNNQEPKVIVTSVCPGLVHTDIARNFTNQSWLMKILVQTFFAMFSKSADYGARFYVSAARASKEQHGKFIISLYSDVEYLKYMSLNFCNSCSLINSLLQKVDS